MNILAPKIGALQGVAVKQNENFWIAAHHFD
jgi:hypothetical protein